MIAVRPSQVISNAAGGIYVYFGLKYACGEGFLRLLLGLAILKAQLKVALSARSSSAGSAPRNWPRSTC